MKIKYLGTAAAEGYPAIFCDCENCRKAHKAAGRNIRTRSQAIIDDVLLIDFPCDTYAHVLHHGMDLKKVRHCLITHTHEDHYYPRELYYLKTRSYSHPPQDWSFTVYGSEDLQDTMDIFVPPAGDRLCYVKILPFQPFAVGKYTVTALKAYHGTDHPYIYWISDGEKSILYAHDTDVFLPETWEYLCKSGAYFDLVSLDCTGGGALDLHYHGHMCLGRNMICRDKMLELGLIDKNTKLVLNHFSHNGCNSTYDELVPLADKEGFLVSYDGMELEA